MEVGIRVVRGPDWQWRNQDDGEGHLGTVVEIGRPGSRTSPEKTVIVQWDSGSRTNYRVGYQSKYDLRIYDNATIGIRHSNVICDNCKKRGIQGIRWKCTKCFDFDLCTHCYMADKHDLTHQFLRFETSTSQGVLMPKRLASVKIAARGIFAGAICVRGPDWEWQNQDGGCGKTGKVIELRGWDRESGMSVACVEWSTTGTTNVYRVGHKGKVDLKYVQEGDGGFYYRDHLIVLGQPIDSNSQLGLESNTSSTTMTSTSTSTTTPTTPTTSSTTTPPTTRQHSELISSDESSSVILDTILPLSPPPTPPTPTASTSIASSTNNNSTSSSPLQSNCLNINQVLGSEMTMSISHNSANMNSNNNNNKTSNGQHESTASSASTQFFSVGDKVRVDVSLDMFKQMQEGHGGWNFKMADLIGKVGTIHRVTDKGDIRVQYEGADNRWTIYPGALTKLSSTFAEGDCVRINSDEEHVKTLQKGHGEWSEKMKMILGKICRVLTVYGDGDLRITYNNFGFTVNSACCTCVSKHQTDIHNTIAYHNMEDAINMANQLKDLLDDNSKVFTPESIDQLVREAAHGNIQAVKDLLSKNPNLIDQKSSGKTALQVSCHQGHVDIVKLLISSKANLEIQDAEGDTALHYSCFGNQPEITELLLQKNSNINSTNKNGCTALHVAVNKQHVNCVKVLLKYKCDVNLQDFYGDTAMHDIIGKEMSKESKQIIDLLLSTPSINLAIRNKRGFNILHYASLKGNAVATEKLISYSPQLVDIKKDDGFSAFHLAALNGHKDVIKILVQSKADKEILNNRRQTPLLLAVAQLHAPIIELLVEKKANVNAFDEDGDTCLHLALNDKLTNSDSGGSNNKHINSCVDLKDCKLLSMISQNMPAEYSNNIRLIISSYLIQNGAKLTKNKHQISPLDYLADAKMSDLLQKQCLAFEQEEIQEKCKLCDEEMRCVVFVPCGHKIVCLECSVRMKKCLDCNQPIKEKVTCDGTPISSSITTKSQFNDLLSKIKSLEEAQICSICMERKKDTAFQCGHIVCNICALPLKTCHICREKIVKRIKIYET